MGFWHADRLDKSRRALADKSRELDLQFEAADLRRAEECAESLRGTLKEALDSLETLYRDEEIWAAARSAVENSVPVDLIDQRQTYIETLPPLLELFGYRVPPPPPAPQLVGETIGLLDEASDAGSPAEEVTAAYQALGTLLERTYSLDEAAPWEVAAIATETNGALKGAIEIATGATTGAMGLVFTSVLAGAVTGGLVTAASMLVLGGARHIKRSRARRERAARLLEERGRLRLGLFPAAKGAVLQHLEEIIAALHARDRRPDDPSIVRSVKDDLDSLLDITRRFAFDKPFLMAPANQSALRGNLAPRELLRRMGELNIFALTTRAALESSGCIDPASIERWEALTASIRKVDLEGGH